MGGPDEEADRLEDHSPGAVVDDNEEPEEAQAGGDDDGGEDGAAMGSHEAQALVPWLERKKGYSLAFDERKAAHYEHYRHVFEAARLAAEGKVPSEVHDADGDDDY